MTQEDKELLIKEICARIPYGVKGIIEGGDVITTPLKWYAEQALELSIKYMVVKNGWRPYLFPMSSMTEKQKEEYHYIVNYISPDDTENWVEGEFVYVNQIEQLLHFYHTNHLDYRGLIPEGLAIDATGLNIY